MFGRETPPSPEAMKQQLQVAMLDITGVLEPIYDTADGMRRGLESRGWSPTVAEQCAGVWLASALQSVMGGGR